MHAYNKEQLMSDNYSTISAKSIRLYSFSIYLCNKDHNCWEWYTIQLALKVVLVIHPLKASSAFTVYIGTNYVRAVYM